MGGAELSLSGLPFVVLRSACTTIRCPASLPVPGFGRLELGDERASAVVDSIGVLRADLVEQLLGLVGLAVLLVVVGQEEAGVGADVDAVAVVAVAVLFHRVGQQPLALLPDGHLAEV